MPRSKGGGCAFTAILAMVFTVFAINHFTHSDRAPTLHANPARTDGTAVFILIDVSGSMDNSVPNSRGARERKLEIAKRAAIDACKSIATYAAEDPKRNIRLAIGSFSDDFVLAYPFAPPDVTAAERAINSLSPSGGTHIGDAVVEAQRALDATTLRGQHLLIITDGENKGGASPENVAVALNAIPELLRPRIYLLAFDVNASVFAGVKEKGWQIYSAPDGKELKEQLDAVIGEKILLER